MPKEINTADGGLDATVTDAARDSEHTIFFEGTTGYQVKSGKKRLSGDGAMIDLLLRPSVVAEVKDGRPPRREDINSRINDLFEMVGSFVVVLSGTDQPDNTKISQAENEIQEFLAKIDQNLQDARIFVWRQNQPCLSG